MHVLLVDDDSDIRTALRLVLEDEGYSVSEADNGRAALDALRDIPGPLLVILDYMMPVMDGPDFLTAVAQDPQLAHERAFILMSGISRVPANIAALMGQLPIALIPKPFDINNLLTQLAQLRAVIAPAVPVVDIPLPDTLNDD